MVSQKFQGEFIRENVVENLYTIEPFSENKIVPCCFGTAEILFCSGKNVSI
jgi:hypothetical protein